jgi:hypothetical protein
VPENDHQIDVLANVTPVGYAICGGALNAILDSLSKFPFSDCLTPAMEESLQVAQHPVLKLLNLGQ